MYFDIFMHNGVQRSFTSAACPGTHIGFFFWDTHVSYYPYFADFVIGDDNPLVVAWRLLEGLLVKYEEPNLTTLHKAVGSKILSLDVVLPYWLEGSYKVRLRMLTNF